MKSLLNNSNRFIPQPSSDCGSARLNGHFEQDIAIQNKAYVETLTEAVFNQSYTSAQSSSIVSFFQARNTKKREYQSQYDEPHQIKQTPKTRELQVSIREEVRGLIDNFYIHPVSWGGDSNVVIALGSHLFTYNTNTNQVKQPFDNQMTENISLVSHMIFNNTIITASFDKSYSTYDTQTHKKTAEGVCRDFPIIVHVDTKPCEGFVGDQGGSIFQIDTRVDNKLNFNCSYQTEHLNQVCSLSFDGNYNLASGFNDNLALIFDIRKINTPVFSIKSHHGAVRALAFSPYNPNFLASGGGNMDKTLQIFNIIEQKPLCYVNTEYAVSNAFWIESDKLLTSAGCDSICELSVWQTHRENGNLKKITQKKEHRERVLFAAQNPKNRGEFLSIADENLIFWKIKKTDDHQKSHSSSACTKYRTIR